MNNRRAHIIREELHDFFVKNPNVIPNRTEYRPSPRDGRNPQAMNPRKVIYRRLKKFFTRYRIPRHEMRKEIKKFLGVA